MDSEKVSELVGALERYREPRLELFGMLGVPYSNHEPLSQWSEHLVAAFLDGHLANNPTQVEWDLATPAGEKIQVRSFTNRSGLKGTWVSEHSICLKEGVDSYALVVFEGLRPLSVLKFPADLTGLKKRTENQESTLELTRPNHLQIMEDRSTFEQLGVEIWTLQEAHS